MQRRRYMQGAELLAPETGRTSFRVFAPDATSVEVVLGERRVGCRRDGDGYWEATLDGVGAGQRYRLALDGGEAFPDPASRLQPEGPHGPSEVVNPHGFAWSDADWPGCQLAGQVVYEFHVGTFTPEGTWAAAATRLEALAELGVTLLEMMPIAEFPGAFGWGYDGVSPWAPYHAYGTPDDLRAFVDRCHAVGLGVVLDVVYNHLGPDGNYLLKYDPQLFSTRHQTDWGSALNFDGPGSAGLRRLFIDNAAYWIDEFHFDGLRLDATQNIYDSSPIHLLSEIGAAARAAAGTRSIVLFAENEPQEARLVRPLSAAKPPPGTPAAGAPAEPGLGLDALWNDDYHHTAMVALTGQREAYYSDYRGSPQELLSAIKWGTLFQGQLYPWQKAARGTPALDLSPCSFVVFLQNHDQVANSGAGLRGDRLASPGRWRALSALTLLAPGTPLLFQGQEFSASAPFLFFADHGGELGRQVASGRRDFLAQFPSLADPAVQARLHDPTDRETFTRSRLDWSERERHPEALAFHRDLLALRRSDSAFSCQKRQGMDGAVLGPSALLLRYFDSGAPDSGEPVGAGSGDRLLLVNLGGPLEVAMGEPLLAPPGPGGWRRRFHSDDPAYGGAGAPEPFDSAGQLRLPAEAAIVLAPRDRA